MLELLSISARELCRILSSEKSDLNQFELAIRDAFEKANPDENELRAIRDKACITDALSVIPITSSGKPKVKI